MSPRFFTTIDTEAMNDLNTTNYKALVTMRLVTFTVIAAMLGFAHGMIAGDSSHHLIALQILDSVFLFLWGMAGVSAAQYAAKRFSDSGYATAKASGQPTQVVQTTAPVVAQAPGGPVNTEAASPAPPPAPRTTPVAGTPRDPREPDLYRDDERGET